MSQTRIVNRPADRALNAPEMADQFGRRSVYEDETNLTIGSALEGRFVTRKDFGRWLDRLNTAVAPKRRRTRRERRS